MKKCHDLLCFAQRRWEKIIRVMKLTITLLLFAALAATAGSTYSQTARINLKMQDATLVDVFREIERTSEFGFFFKSEELDLNKRISIDLFLGRTTIALPVIHEHGADIFTEPHVAPRLVIRS